MYSWTLLGRDINETPFLLGVSGELAEAMRVAEPHLIAGHAFLCHIEEVEQAMTVHGMDSCHVPTGRTWFGRRNNSDGVTWQERERPFWAAPAATTSLTTPG